MSRSYAHHRLRSQLIQYPYITTRPENEIKQRKRRIPDIAKRFGPCIGGTEVHMHDMLVDNEPKGVLNKRKFHT
jgi:hypothetical protein